MHDELFCSVCTGPGLSRTFPTHVDILANRGDIQMQVKSIP